MISRLAVAVVLVPSLALAQDFPDPKPTAAHAVLKKDAGTWDCAVKMYLAGPASDPSEFKGVERSQLVSGGLHLRTVFECQMGDRKFVGHGLAGYDAESEKYLGTWVDNFTSGPVQTEGTYDAEANTMTVLATVREAGRTMKQKQVTKYNADGSKEFTILLTEVDGQKVEFTLMEMTCKRRKATESSSDE